jgi:hypothetical protein
MSVASTPATLGVIAPNAPTYKVSVAYPSATVAAGAYTLTMSLAAVTVLATLF